jgi:hypothetical protein
MDEDKERKVSPLSAFIIGFLLAVLIIAPMIILLVYFSDVPDSMGYTMKNEAFTFGSGIALATTFVLALIFVTRAIRKPQENE